MSLSLFDGATRCYGLVYTPDDLKLWEDRVNGEEFAFDVETEGVSFPEAEILGVSVAIAGASCYVPVVDYRNELPGFNARAALRFVRSLAKSDRLKIAHNLQFDMRCLLELGFDVAEPWGCTQVAAFTHDCTAQGFSLKDVSSRYGMPGVRDYKDFCAVRNMSSHSLHDIGNYSIPHAERTLRLHKILSSCLVASGQWLSYWDIDMPCIPSTIWIEQCGMAVSEQGLADISTNISNLLTEVDEKIYSAIGDVDSGSPAQLRKVLYEQLGLPVKRFTEKGLPSTDKESLQALADSGYDVAAWILQRREYVKQKSTYTDGLRQHIRNGRIYTSLSMTTARSGRFSSRDPNTQNIPQLKDVYGIRGMFVAEPGNALSVADYSQIEMRLAAVFSGDPALWKVFESDGDLHANTAKSIFGKVTKETRYKGKTINFAVGYGMGPHSLAESLKCSMEEANSYLKKYWETYRRLHSWNKWQILMAWRRGYTSTLCGRHRMLHNIDSDDYGKKSADERIATNHPIQGTSAEILKLAQTALHKEFKNEAGVKCVLSVHDELGLEAPEDVIEEVGRRQAEIMANIVTLPIALKVEYKTGHSWKDCH